MNHYARGGHVCGHWLTSSWCLQTPWHQIGTKSSTTTLTLRMNDVLRNTYIAYHHDDVTKWKYFPRYWSFLRGIHRSPVDSSHKANDTELWCFPWSAPEQRLSKQSRRRWFETLLHSLWRHCNDSWINRVIESTSQLDCRIPVDGICYWRVCLLIGIIFDEHPLWWCGNFLHRHITYTNGTVILTKISSLTVPEVVILTTDEQPVTKISSKWHFQGQ